MDTAFNPFVPGRPVPADLFIGRVAQLDRLAQAARDASTGRLGVAYLAGERGIGKTSLLAFLRHFLQRELGILGVHVFLSGAETLEDVLQRIFEQIVRAAREDRPTHGQEDLLDPANGALDAVVHALIRRLHPRYRGMMLVLDDLEEVSGSGPFAHWIKTFVDAASTSGAEPPLFLVLAGTEESRRTLMGINPSLGRPLQSESLGPWTEEETAEFFRHAFRRGGRAATPDAVRTMAAFCQGRPAIAHKLGDVTYRGDEDAHVTREDAMRALFDLEPRQDGRAPEPYLTLDAEAAAPVARRAAGGARNGHLLSVLRSLI